MRAIVAAGAVLLLGLPGCGAHDVLNDAFGPDGRTIRETIASFPAEHQLAFGLMERRCTKCHTLNEPFAAHVPAGAWRGEVHKMTRKPGAGIPEADEVRIVAFLEYYTEQRRAAGSGDKK